MYYLVFSDKALLKLKFEIRSFASLYPKLFFPLMMLIGKYPGRSVQKDTELVIEGFPRSANSFSMGAFLSVQKRPVILASHLHAAAQIIRASRLSIPTLLLIRQPKDAVLSLLTLEIETNVIDFVDRDLVKLSLQKYLVNWIDFYTRTMPYRRNYVIGLFDEVTTDFGAIIERINHRFNTEFDFFVHTKQKAKEIHDGLGFHAGPSWNRQVFKKNILPYIAEDRKLNLLIKEAEAIYKQFEIMAQDDLVKFSKMRSKC